MMKLASGEWFWLIVFAVAALLQLLGKRQSARKSDEAPAVRKTKQRLQSRPPPFGQAAPPKIPAGSQGIADQIRRLLDEIQRAAQPPEPAPAAPPPIRETVSAPTPAAAVPPPIQETAGAPTPAPKPPPSPSPITELQPTPASAWAQALRNKQNLRHIIISAEIIGPPKGA
jgi:hypothetical protein